MVALVLSAGHRIWTDEDTPTKVTVSGQRRGTNAVETVTWTNDRAKKAGYTTNKKYDTDPQAMLYARASGDIARRIAPDVLAGLAYTVEEMELSEQPATVTRTRTTAKKTAKREQLDPPTPDEPDLDEPAKSAADINPHGDTPEPITEQQMKKLQASYGDAGITERQDKLDYAVTIIDRPLDSARDLSKDEASKVIDALAQYGSVDPSATDEQTELDPAEGDGWGT
ncbi:MAG: hypothetical protein ACRDP4_05640, partial [Nocardioidaceae bacterium]